MPPPTVPAPDFVSTRVKLSDLDNSSVSDDVPLATAPLTEMEDPEDTDIGPASNTPGKGKGKLTGTKAPTATKRKREETAKKGAQQDGASKKSVSTCTLMPINSWALLCFGAPSHLVPLLSFKRMATRGTRAASLRSQPAAASTSAASAKPRVLVEASETESIPDASQESAPTTVSIQCTSTYVVF